MTDNTIFDHEDDFTPDLTQDDHDFLTEYVGEGKKYKDVQALAKAIYHKDTFIEQLKRENAGVRQELNTRVKIEEFLDRMNSLSNQNTDNDNNQSRDTGTEKTAITAEDIQKIIDQREQERVRNENLKSVKDTLSKQLGPNYVAKVKQLATEVGISDKEVDRMAAESPAVLYRVLGIDSRGSQQQSFEPTPPRSQVNTQAISSRPNTPKYSDFEKLRKEKPNEYWQPKIQNEILRLTEQYGRAFLDS